MVTNIFFSNECISRCSHISYVAVFLLVTVVSLEHIFEVLFLAFALCVSAVSVDALFSGVLNFASHVLVFWFYIM
jgi:hypothetical protein